MLKREAKPTQLETYECCGKSRDPETQGRFKFAGTNTWLCLACYDAELLKRETPAEPSVTP